MIANESWLSFWGDKNVLENDAWRILCMYQKALTCALKGVNGTADELHCNKGGVNWRLQMHGGVRLLPAKGQGTSRRDHLRMTQMTPVFENTEIYTTEGASRVELVKSTHNTKKILKLRAVKY